MKCESDFPMNYLCKAKIIDLQFVGINDLCPVDYLCKAKIIDLQ